MQTIAIDELLSKLLFLKINLLRECDGHKKDINHTRMNFCSVNKVSLRVLSARWLSLTTISLASRDGALTSLADLISTSPNVERRACAWVGRDEMSVNLARRGREGSGRETWLLVHKSVSSHQGVGEGEGKEKLR